ncbi:MAG: T9SS type A sorting domain-containing protein, partial [Bacteroidetes bacterium]|nr:T9SS type A sorting domain-containing protein [Bacteroidota bacterium]
TRYELSQNYPNPFNPTTSIRFAVPTTEQATVKVYDMAGREVAVLFNQVAAAGQIYNVQFTGTGLASGIYLYVLQTQSYREVKKMSLLK